MDNLPRDSRGKAGKNASSESLNGPYRAAGVAARGLVRLIYTNNPFYLISAWLVFWGLRSSFDTAGESFETGALMIGLTGYTALLAASACFLIRVGQVWDDVRGMLILVVLMFLAISVTFDDALAANPRAGAACFLGGLAFAVLVSEGVLFGIRLPLPMLFRVPYYLILALFYLYPLALSKLIRFPKDPALCWALFGFSSLAGLGFLTLLPAVRRGPAYVRTGTSPWAWPWYPWILFGVLGLGVCGRAYYLCVSLHFVGGTATIFAPYFWIPFLLAVNLLLLEIGLVSRSKATVQAALIVPVALVAMAITGPAAQADDHGFLARFMLTTGASPLFLTLVGMTAFYGLAAIRKVPYAVGALCGSLAILCFCGPSTVDPATLVSPRGLPLLAVAALQGWITLRRPNAARCLLAAGCLVAGITLELQGTAFTAHRWLIPIHLLLGTVLLIGATFRGKLARLVQHIGAVLMLGAGVVYVTIDPKLLDNPPSALMAVYPALVMAASLAYGRLVRNRWYFASALGTLGSWLGVRSWRAYRHVRRTLPGLDYIAWGILFFLLAMLISLTKAGLPQRWLARRKNRTDP